MNELDKYEHAVTVIRQAIENSRYRALKAGNAEMLSLYYGIENTFQKIHAVEHGVLMPLEGLRKDCNKIFLV